MTTELRQVAWGTATAGTTPVHVDLSAVDFLGARTYVLSLSLLASATHPVYARCGSNGAAASGEALHVGSTWRSPPTSTAQTSWYLYAAGSQVTGYTVAAILGES